MTGCEPGVRNSARVSAAVRFLRLLVRAGTRAQAHGDGGRIVIERTGKPSEVLIDAETYQHALREGLIAVEPNDALRITRRGRTLLRRHLSGGGVSCVMTPAGRPRDGAEKPRIDVCESPLAWLSQRKDKAGRPLISQAQLDAGERLRADFNFAQMTPRVTVNWSGAIGAAQGRRSAPGTGVDIQDHVIAAAERVRRALAAVGPELSGILIDVCCHLKGLEEAERIARWPQRSGRIVLLLALSSLARHYGFERAAPASARSNPIRHWGAQDYRPAIEAGE